MYTVCTMIPYFSAQYKRCLCGERFTSKDAYFTHRRQCQFDADKSFQTLRLYIHTLDTSIYAWKRNFHKCTSK